MAIQELSFFLGCLGVLQEIAIREEFCSMKATLRNAILSPPWLGVAWVRRCPGETAAM